MGRIIFPDEADRLPATFADDHYLPDLKHEHVKIVAQLPAWSDVRWYHDLVRRFRHEVKSTWVLKHWNSLDGDLRANADRCIREALITISDSALQELELKAQLENHVMKKRFTELPQDVRQKMETLVQDHIEMEVLYDSPAYAAMRYAHGSDADFKKLRRKLGSPHNVRLFGARVAAALVEYLDPARRAAAVESVLADRRFLPPGEITGLFLADALSPDRTFDQGNSRVHGLISDLLGDLAARVRASQIIILPSDAGAAVEGESSKIPHIAAADVAAGVAAALYRSADGVRKVVERFRMVILNGSVVKM